MAVVPDPGWTWHDRWLNFRNRLLSDPGFHRFALKFPFTRPISRTRSRRLFDLVAGFVYSQTLYTCVRLDLFKLLAAGPLPVDDIARRTGWTADNLHRLLGAAAALGLLERFSGGRYGLGPHGAALVGNLWVARFVEHHDILYRDLLDPVGLLRGAAGETGLTKYWAYARATSPGDLPDEAATDYTELMAASQTAVAAEILDCYDFGRHGTLLDVGGGDGSFLTAVAARYPALKLMLFDLPAVTSKARLKLAAVGDRVTIESGSFLSDSLPRGADAATLIRVIHDHDDNAAVKIMANVKRALNPGGALIIAEPLTGIKGTEAVSEAYFNIYFAAMGSGRTRSQVEIKRLGEAAGYLKIRRIRTRNPLLVSLIILTT